jgi:hypothetical protein
VVAVRSFSILEDEDQLMLTSVEGSHPRVVFGPDTEVLEFGIHCFASCEDFLHVAPVHAYEVHRTFDGVPGSCIQSIRKKGGELGWAHFTGGHHKIRMVVLA